VKPTLLVGIIIVAILILATCSPATQNSDQLSQAEFNARATQVMETLMAPPPGITTSPQINTPVAALPQQPVVASTPQVQPTAQSKPQAAPASNSTAMINADQLNLRVGPGFTYKIARTLPRGEVVTPVGRSSDGDWIEVHLQDGSGGWVFASYLLTSADLVGLPISQASGGPVSQPVAPAVPAAAAVPAAPASPFAVLVTIAANQAQTTISRFPASKPITATLATTGGSKSVVVASGQTDANGAAVLNFDMPFTWPDGTPVTQTSLVIIVSTTDGAFSRRATISYASGR
jgi:SH3-like domain-containing protein